MKLNLEINFKDGHCEEIRSWFCLEVPYKYKLIIIIIFHLIVF
jgi:hypothetical protein